MSQRTRIPTAFLGIGLASTTLFAACSPLPGGTLDPVYLKLPWRKGTPESTQAASASAPPAASSAVGAGARVWVGRYRDSRGEGDVTFSLTRSQSMMSGSWKTRMGGGGPVVATIEADGQRWQLRMENSAAECPGSFDGSLETRGDTLVGTYHGKDCEGPVSDGSLELHPK